MKGSTESQVSLLLFSKILQRMVAVFCELLRTYMYVERRM